MKLFFAGASPFVAKVRMAAELAEVPLELVAVDVTQSNLELKAANPLSKIPTLLTDEGLGLFDSRVITRHIDRVSGNRLYPTSPSQLQAAELCEALCDGINDSAVGCIYERRFRPEEIVHQPWIDRLWGKVESGLNMMDGRLAPLGDGADITTVCFAATLGYLDFRFAGQWRDQVPQLSDWMDQFDASHPNLSALKPKG